MNGDLQRLLCAHGGVLRRADALAGVAPHVVAQAMRSGRLRRAFPTVHVAARDLDDPQIRRSAAVAWAGPGAALSHASALVVWRLLAAEPGSVHIVVPADRRRRSRAGVVVHRRASIEIRVRDDLPVTTLEVSLVDSWAVLGAELRVDVVIAAVADRLTTPERLQVVARAAERLPGRVALLVLLERLATGCRSRLEIYGHEAIFEGLGIPPIRWNFRVVIGQRTCYLDAYCPEARVAFELDGAGTHAGTRDRERDVARDAALAAAGILVVRFTRRRLLAEPEAVRHEIVAIVRSRLPS